MRDTESSDSCYRIKYLLAYKRRWLNEYPWLESIPLGKVTKMLCALCKTFFLHNPTILSIPGEDLHFINGHSCTDKL